MDAPQKTKRSPTLRWVPLDQIKVSTTAQRNLRPAFVNRLVAHMDLDALGYPVVSYRDGVYWVIDGQHRVEAMRRWAGDSQLLECEVFDNLTEAQEAEEFLQRQTRINVRPIDEFRIAVTAGRHDECEIERIVLSRKLSISSGQTKHGIQAVGVLKWIYEKGGAGLLDSAIAVSVGAFNQQGVNGHVLKGVALVLAKYPNTPCEDFRRKLVRTPFQMLSARAATFKLAYARPMAECFAAAIIEIVNTGSRSKLPGWFRDE